MNPALPLLNVGPVRKLASISRRFRVEESTGICGRMLNKNEHEDGEEDRGGEGVI